MVFVEHMQCSGQNNTVWAWWNVFIIALGYKEVEQSSSSSLWVFFLYLSNCDKTLMTCLFVLYILNYSMENGYDPT